MQEIRRLFPVSVASVPDSVASVPDSVVSVSVLYRDPLVMALVNTLNILK